MLLARTGCGAIEHEVDLRQSDMPRIWHQACILNVLAILRTSSTISLSSTSPYRIDIQRDSSPQQ